MVLIRWRIEAATDYKEHDEFGVLKEIIYLGGDAYTAPACRGRYPYITSPTFFVKMEPPRYRTQGITNTAIASITPSCFGILPEEEEKPYQSSRTTNCKAKMIPMLLGGRLKMYTAEVTPIYPPILEVCLTT